MSLFNTIVIALMWLAGYLLFPYLPEMIPTHWNVLGQVDATAPKSLGVWMLPAITLAMAILFKFTPRLDPKKEKYEEFALEWKIIQAALISFFAYIYGATLYIALNPAVSMMPLMFAGLGTLFIVLGNYLSKIRQNFFIGVKVPWTLASVDNWNKTHRYASWTFVIAGIVTLLEAKFLWYAPIIVFSGIMLAAFLPILYSFLLFKKQVKLIKYLYLALVLVALSVAALRFSTPEDTWLCSKGVWVEHGHPSSPKPTQECN